MRGLNGREGCNEAILEDVKRYFAELNVWLLLLFVDGKEEEE
jgi:hypothetical protein